MTEGSMQSKGGHARAEALSPEQRSEIASAAAAARWGIPQATHTGELKIGHVVIRCAVLEDRTRVLTQRDFLQALGRSGKPAAGRGSADLVLFEKGSPLLDSENLKPFISNELFASISPVQFRVPEGARAWGYKAELLPKVCEVYLQARDAGALRKNQLKFATACDVLMRALAHVGIIALVDEATGYQEVRDRLALQKILDLFINKELSRWAKRFPDEFYKEMFRLKGWQWQGMKINRPSVVGHYTNDVVYQRLAPGVLDELKRINPPDEAGQRKHRHHQWLTPDVGHPKLRDHLNGVIALMRASTSWDQFKRMADRAFPKMNTTMLLPFTEND